MTIKHGKAAWENPENYDAMSELTWCSSLSHNGLTGLGGTRGFSVHACGHELSAEFDLTHGASMAVAFTAVSRYTCAADPARYARYARNVWGVTGGTEMEQAQEGIRRTVEYFRSLELPVCAEDFLHRAFTEKEIEDMTERCSVGGAKILRNVMDLYKDDVRKIFTMMNEKI
jgi:alcohol dehydrogenase YqhD (iron-dependent ADH family)